MSMDPEILQDYLPEARELLERAQSDVLALEEDPQNDAVLASLFRAFHTLKGGAGFLDADALVDWTHHLEDLLDKLRSHALPVTSARIDAILRGIDVIEGMLSQMAQRSFPSRGPEDLEQLIIRLSDSAEDAEEEISCNGGASDNSSFSTAVTTASVEIGSEALAAPREGAGSLLLTRTKDADGQEGLFLEQCGDGSCPPPTTVVANDEISEAEFERYMDQLYGGKAPGFVDLALSAELANTRQEEIGVTSASPAETGPAESHPQAAPSPNKPSMAGGGNIGGSNETTLRVDANRLDDVMNQVGELVLLRNRYSAAIAALATEDEGLSRIAREMDLTINDLQTSVMRLRMQPCKRLFQQLPRVIRDASRTLGKTVRLELVGEEVEIDKTVVDGLSGPLTHLVRNSLDHGIESPDERKAQGKDPSAILRIAAIHLGDRVRIEVSDDGRGIDRQTVTQKAIEKGVITATEAAHLSEKEALELIFRPGFSTKEEATELSGRGVGMDVVRETVRNLRGRLEIDTKPRSGTSISMEFPLTLAVLPVLYVRLRRDTYALPISVIENLLDIDQQHIHRLGTRVLYRVDEKSVVPLIDLGEILQNQPLQLGTEAVEGVLTDRGLLVLSEVLGNEDSVIKPVDFVGAKHWYQGATISGKGRVVLILDPQVLVREGVDRQVATSEVL
ncbi:MAG: chemotaxis protein CheA [Acidithiobacillus sp.]